MTTFETPYGTVDAPNLQAAQKWIASKKPPPIPVTEPPDRTTENREAGQGATDAGAMSAEASPFGDGGLKGAWSRMLSGMGGGDVSRAGRFGMGVADPAVGLMQAGSRAPVMTEAMPFMPEEMAKAAQPDTKAVDTAVQQREARYQQGEKKAGLSGGLASEWARLLGNVAGTAPLAALPAGGATIPGRIGMAALGGAAGGAAMPVTGGDFGTQKALQAGEGALGGAALGSAAEGVGPLVGRIGREMMPESPPPTAATQISPAVGQQVQKRFQQAAPMSRAGVNDAGGIQELQAKRLQSVRNIVADKPNLVFDTPRGEETGRLPNTVAEHLEAHDQSMEKLFQKFNAMTEKTEGAAVPPSVTSTINKFREVFNAASSKVAETNENLRMAKLKLEAELRSPGGESTGSIRAATRALHKAEDRAKAAESERINASKEMQKPWVDLKPIAADLDRFASDPAIEGTSGSGPVIAHAKKEAAKYRDMEAISPKDAQAAIKNMNSRLKAFYKQPSYESAANAAVDAMVANHMRKGLDDLINKLTGPGYQAFKNQYGAMAASRRDVFNAAVKSMGNTPEAKFVDGLINVGTGTELVHGIASMHFDPMMRALLFRAGRMLQSRLESPDRQVRLMFQQAERAMQGRQPYRPPAMSIGLAGAAGGEAPPLMSRREVDQGAAARERRRDLYETTPVSPR